jgi:hypothetical protein
MGRREQRKRKADGEKQSAFYPIQSISWKETPQMNLFSTRDEVYHREQRKIVANAYSMASLLEMESAVDSDAVLFMEKVRAYADRGKSVDLGAWLYASPL